MEITQQAVTDNNVLVKINLTADDYMSAVDTKVRDYSKKLNIKGFRAGKVPSGVVKKMFGREILVKEINDLVNNGLSDYLKNNDIHLLGDPLPKDLPADFDIYAKGAYDFTFELGVKPDFEVNMEPKSAKLTKYEVELDDEDLEKEIKHVRRMFGERNEATAMDANCEMEVEFAEIGRKGEIVEDGFNAKAVLMLHEIASKKLTKALDGAQAKASFEVDIFKDFVGDRKELARKLLGKKDYELPKGRRRYRMTILEVRTVSMAEIGQKLFDDAFGEGKVTSEEEFREKLMEHLKNSYQRRCDDKLAMDMRDALIEATEIKLPEDFLRRWLEKSREQHDHEHDHNHDHDHEHPEITDEYFADFTKDLRWQLIVGKLSDDHKLMADKDAIMAEIKDRYRAYGFNEEESLMDSLAERTLQQGGEVIEQIAGSIQSRNLYNFLRENIRLKDKQIGAQEFDNLY